MRLYEPHRKESNSNDNQVSRSFRRHSETAFCSSVTKVKNIESEPGQVLTLSHWYKTKTNMDVHVVHHGTKTFDQVHLTTDELRPSSGSYFV